MLDISIINSLIHYIVSYTHTHKKKGCWKICLNESAHTDIFNKKYIFILQLIIFYWKLIIKEIIFYIL